MGQENYCTVNEWGTQAALNPELWFRVRGNYSWALKGTSWNLLVKLVITWGQWLLLFPSIPSIFGHT